MPFNTLTPDITVSPQILPADVAEIAAKGFTVMVSNRPDGEEPGQPTTADIAAAAEAAGIAFHHLPFAGNGITDTLMADFATVMEEAAGPVFAFCRSGTRSCVLWALVEARSGRSDVESIMKSAAGGGYDLTGQRPVLEQLANNG